MAGMTPTRPQKRRVTSPLQEMDGEEEELVELDGSGSETSAPSLSAIASIVRQEMQTAIAPVEAQLSSMQATFGNRLSNVEAKLADHDLKIGKLEQLTVNKSVPTNVTQQVEKQLADLQSQLDTLKAVPVVSKADIAKTVVVGGLEDMPSLNAATQWLTDKLRELGGPCHTGTYMKSSTFKGLVFAKFNSSYDRDMAAALLRSASMTCGDKHVWATQDLPIPVRARKMFLLGLRWQLGEWGFSKREIEVGDEYFSLMIAGKVVVKLTNTIGRRSGRSGMISKTAPS
ncbi:unnamed protein product [Effrenium voratum]|uniref:Uncharacterized protein n=1 Tax=Effrenium voratum TaxID=2562239 RepID=A0AA36MV54_9DINO|nr:unnamed protein product [Effrenium voratum]